MITELEETATALRHQAHACFLTAENKRRVHAPTVLALQADLESALALRNRADLLEVLKKINQTCLSCIRVTALTGRTPHCIVEDLPEFEQKIRGLDHAKWQKIPLQDLEDAEGFEDHGPRTRHEKLLKQKR